MGPDMTYNLFVGTLNLTHLKLGRNFVTGLCILKPEKPENLKTLVKTYVFPALGKTGMLLQKIAESYFLFSNLTCPWMRCTQ